MSDILSQIKSTLEQETVDRLKTLDLAIELLPQMPIHQTGQIDRSMELKAIDADTLQWKFPISF